ncbi:MAG TPA: choice-of-anchor Q domain-containing protein [Verrucomicrobiae bacterium]|jgi:hypothetical protein
MKTSAWLVVVFFLASVLTFNLKATTYYVDAGGTNPVAPYSLWSTAATNIQDAAVYATTGDTILVTNGVYQYGSTGNNSQGYHRVFVGYHALLRSVNGPDVTTIVGSFTGQIRCVYLGAGATLSGFTLTNGEGGNAAAEGGGVFVEPGATVTNCVMVGNYGQAGGGGCWGNHDSNPGNCTVINCVIKQNYGPYGSGVDGCLVYNCLLTGNNNGSAAYGGTLYNCTIVGNNDNGPNSIGGANSSTLVNCIIYNNTNGVYADCYQCVLTNCCTTVGPGNTSLPNNSISNAPIFLNPSAGDYHLQIGSSGIDAGTNSYVMGTDLDGNPRIANGVVDMGCYENQNTNPVHYASLSSTNPVAPYTNWLTAATNIQDAVAVAQAGNIVAVDAGVYTNAGVVISGNETNVVALTNGITLLGVYGRQSTIIKGGILTRCAYVGSNSVLSGFTITNGRAQNLTGGGILCQPGGLVANCLVISNSANFPGTYSGGSGGGIYGGMISNCTLAWNTAGSGGGVGGGASVWNCIFTNNVANGGGGACLSILNGCLLSNNLAAYNGNSGMGGAMSNCVAYNCTMKGNIASTGEGGASFLGTNFNCFIIGNSTTYGGGTYQSTNYDCVLSNNFASNYGGGADGGALYNCLLAFNVTSNSITFYGLGGGTYGASLYNCTVVSNSASGGGGGAYGIGIANNCIIMFNTVTGVVQNVFGGENVFYSCMVPTPVTYNGHDITNDPVFVNPAAGDFHLQYTSPCINAGTNFLVSTATDLDGNPRIAGYSVDMGAYEKTPPSIIPNWWLFQYGLTNDGSADFKDLDGTGMPNWEKWKAGLNPTNPASVLAASAPTPMSDGSGTTVTWQSVTDIVYFVEQSTNLSAQPAFYPIQSNIMGQAGTTSYLDVTATNGGPYFYRVGVQ